jgi:UDP-N-acetylmuramate--alanine ligase
LQRKNNILTNKPGNIYFLGIGGIGMSALARYFKSKGAVVSGYDRTPSALTAELQSEGIDIHFVDNPDLIPDDTTLVIYTPAVPKSLKEYQYIESKGIEIRKRAEILGEISAEYNTIAVAGTHGKTTVSTMITWLLKNSEIKCNAILGGISKNLSSNVLLSEDAGILVTEADEYDRSFLRLQPDFAVITSADADHLDIYNDKSNLLDSFSQFAEKVKPGGTLLIKRSAGLNFNSKNYKIYSYSLDGKADFYAVNIRLSDDKYTFDLVTPDGIIKNLTPGIPGLINLENSVAALATALLYGADEDELREALPDFKGIKRRFDYQIRSGKIIYIDDYAHHPVEIQGVLNSVKSLYPEKKTLVIFQPHLYSRTRDFAEDFAESLDLADEVILLPIYPARELPVDGVSSEMILKRMTNEHKLLMEKSDIPGRLGEFDFDIIITLGAGDIDRLVKPVKEFLMQKKSQV